MISVDLTSIPNWFKTKYEHLTNITFRDYIEKHINDGGGYKLSLGELDTILFYCNVLENLEDFKKGQIKSFAVPIEASIYAIPYETIGLSHFDFNRQYIFKFNLSYVMNNMEYSVTRDVSDRKDLNEQDLNILKQKFDSYFSLDDGGKCHKVFKGSLDTSVYDEDFEKCEGNLNKHLNGLGWIKKLKEVFSGNVIQDYLLQIEQGERKLCIEWIKEVKSMLLEVEA